MNTLAAVITAIMTTVLIVAIPSVCPQPENTKGVRIRFANFSDVVDIDFTTTRAIYHSVRLQNTQTFEQYVLDHFAAPQVSQYFDFYVPPQAIRVEEISSPTFGKEVSLNLETPSLKDQHQYTVVLLGHKAKNSLKLILIDETEAFQDIDWIKESPQIWINSVDGVNAFDVADTIETVARSIKYGDYQVIKFPVASNQQVSVSIAGDPDSVFIHLDATYEPNYYYLVGVSGFYLPNKSAGVFFSPVGSSAVSVTDWLRSYGSINFRYKDVRLKFNTFLELLQISHIDLNDLQDITLSASGVFLLAPTDQAFEKLPVGYLDAIKQDPAKLRNLLLYHMLGVSTCAPSVDSFYQLATLHGALVSLEARNGQVTFGSSARQIECWEMQRGTVAAIDTVLLPPEKLA